jgi:hypothetical protein
MACNLARCMQVLNSRKSHRAFAQEREIAVMTGMRALLLATAAITMGGVSAAQAALTIQSSVGGAPNVAGVIRDNLDWMTLGAGTPQGPSPQSGITINLSPNALAVQGAVSGQYAAPVLSGGNGTGFGNPIGIANQPNGTDTTTYLTSGSFGAVVGAAAEIVLPGSGGYTYFGLLWGSVDTYNTLSFYDGATLVGTIVGTQVTPAATGDQGAQGTFYVNVTSTLPFTRVVATSSQFAFEFDNIAFARDNPFNVPAPAALGVFGMGLLGLAWATRRRRTA